MKLLNIAAIGFALATLASAGTASAQDWHQDRQDHNRYEHRQDRDRYEHRWDRHRGWDRGHPYYRSHRGYRGRVVCWTEWHHHHPVRVCRRR